MNDTNGNHLEDLAIEDLLKTKGGFPTYVVMSLKQIKKDLRDGKIVFSEHDSRIKVIENWKTKLGGAWALLIILTSGILAIVSLIITLRR